MGSERSDRGWAPVLPESAYSSTTRLRGAYGITAESVKALAELFSSFSGGACKISVILEPEQELEADDVEAVLSDTTLKAYPIRRLTLRAANYGAKPATIAQFDADARALFEGIKLTLAGRREAVADVREKASNEIEHTA